MASGTDPVSPLPRWLLLTAAFTSKAVNSSVLWLSYAIGLYFNVALFQNLTADTTAVTNAAFAIAATMSALVFTWCQSLQAEDPDRPSLLYAGERFFEASLSVLLASLLKYAARALSAGSVLPATPWVEAALRGLIGLLSAVLFLTALLAVPDHRKPRKSEQEPTRGETASSPPPRRGGGRIADVVGCAGGREDEGRAPTVRAAGACRPGKPKRGSVEVFTDGSGSRARR